MKFIPFDNFVIKTHLSPETALNKLSDEIEHVKTFRYMLKEKPKKKYEGYIKNNTFEIKRMVMGKNSFIPQIYGKILSDETGKTEIHIKINFHLAVLIILCIFMFFSIAILILGKLNEDSFYELHGFTMTYFPLILIAFAYFLAMIPFNLHRFSAKKDLQHLFEDLNRKIN